MSKFADQLVFFLFLVSIPAITVVDGSRNEVVAGYFVIFYESLLILWLLCCGGHARLAEALSAFRWIWLALATWLVFGYLQAFSLLGLYSADGYASYKAMLYNTGLASALALAMLLLRDARRMKVAILVVITLAAVQALFGMVNYYGKSPVLGWSPTHWSSIRVTGTYVNRNFFANLLLMVVGFCLVPLLLPASRRAGRDDPGHDPDGGAWSSLLARTVLYALLSVLLLAGLILSGSRAAFISFFLALGVTVLLAVLSSRGKLAIGAIIGTLVATVLLFGSSLLYRRMQEWSTGVQTRWEQWVPTLDLFRQRGLSGHGPGTYEFVFRTRSRGELGPMTYNHAHNDYLELLINQGVVGGILWALMVGMIVWVMIRRVFRTRSNGHRRLLLAILFGCVAMLSHAAMDFPLQVPANTVLFLMLLGMGVNAAVMNPDSSGEFVDRKRRSRA
jgi:O-antigen ligase